MKNSPLTAAYKRAAQDLQIPLNQANALLADQLSLGPMIGSLFVYGSLRQGGQHENVGALLTNGGLITPRKGTATICGILYDCGAYPGVRLSQALPAPKVVGEIWTVNDISVWGLLHHFEGCWPFEPQKAGKHSGSLYRLAVTLAEGKEPVGVYVYNGRRGLPDPTREPTKRITSGDWILYRSAIG